jgi:hypothetical protein
MLDRFLEEHPNIHERLYVATPEAIKLGKQESLKNFQKDCGCLGDSGGTAPILDSMMAELDILCSEK